MDFATAKAHRLTFGKYYGKTLDEIGSTDQGLLYLDYMRGEIEKAGNRRTVLAALAAYLDDPTVAGDVAKLAKERA